MTGHLLQRFLEEPGGHLLLDDKLIIVDVGPYFAKMAGSSREEICGKPVKDIFPDSSSTQSKNVEALIESLQRVRDTGGPDKLPPLSFLLHHPEASDLKPKWEERWWEITNIPLVENGTTYIVQRVEDRTIEQTAYRAIRAQRRSNYILYLLCVTLIGIISYVGFHDSSKIATVGDKSCRVQATALPANHQLTLVMEDIRNLLGASPVTPAQKEAQRKETPQTRSTLKDLNTHLDDYINITDREPTSRKCP